jgi:hypothetical protein
LFATSFIFFGLAVLGFFSESPFYGIFPVFFISFEMGRIGARLPFLRSLVIF